MSPKLLVCSYPPVPMYFHAYFILCLPYSCRLTVYSCYPLSLHRENQGHLIQTYLISSLTFCYFPPIITSVAILPFCLSGKSVRLLPMASIVHLWFGFHSFHPSYLYFSICNIYVFHDIYYTYTMYFMCSNVYVSHTTFFGASSWTQGLVHMPYHWVALSPLHNFFFLIFKNKIKSSSSFFLHCISL